MGIAAAAAIGAVGAVGGGLIASSGAKSAAKTQAAAADRSAELQKEMFEKQVELQEPFRQGGMAAQQQLMYLLGIGSPSDYQAQPAPAAAPAARPTGATGPFAGPLNYLNRQMGAQGTQPVAPSTRPAFSGPTGEFGSLAKPFGMGQFNADPGYAFRQSEGMKALERSAAARGGLLSGSAMKGIQRFGQDLASQEYQNAFNRYQVERAARLNPLQSLMGAGQSSANTLTSAAGGLGQGLAQSELAAGQARASGYVGSANALSGALGGIGQAAMQYPMYQAQTNYLNSMARSGNVVPSSTFNNAFSGMNFGD